MNELKQTSEIFKKLADIGWKHKIKGESLNKYSLLQPVNIIFEHINKEAQILDLETITAVIIQKIRDYIERTSGYIVKGEKYEAVEEFVNEFIKELFEKNYRKKVSLISADERNIKAAYLFYIRNNINSKN